MTEPFGFNAHFNGYDYIVDLPHNCDEWVITWKPDKDDAVEELKLFIEEAQKALTKLQGME